MSDVYYDVYESTTKKKTSKNKKSQVKVKVMTLT